MLPSPKRRSVLKLTCSIPEWFLTLFCVYRELDPGCYQAQVQFNMAGDWVILLHVTLPDGNTTKTGSLMSGAFDPSQARC